MDAIEINRAPVLTLWALVVARRLGFDEDEAATMGKALAGLTANRKGTRLGIFEPTPDSVREARQRRREEEGAFAVSFLGREVPVVRTDAGLRALDKDAPIDPASVRRYLHGRFGGNHDAVREAMQRLADSRPPQRLAAEAFDLYMRFRPDVPEGKRGWGARGVLSLAVLGELANAP